MNNITWSFMSKTPVTNEEIQAVEQYLNIKLPNDFVACVKKYDGDILIQKYLMYQDKMRMYLAIS